MRLLVVGIALVLIFRLYGAKSIRELTGFEVAVVVLLGLTLAEVLFSDVSVLVATLIVAVQLMLLHLSTYRSR